MVKWLLLVIITLTFISGFIYTIPIHPINLDYYDYKTVYTAHRIASFFNISYKLAEDITKASLQEGINPYFVASLIFTESSFNPKAVSSKGYKGLTQIKWDVPYHDINIILGIRILKEKLASANGDVRLAVLRYKGYREEDKRGWQQVNKVMSIYNKLNLHIED